MDSKKWQIIRNGCPIRRHRYGKYRCMAKSNGEFSAEECKYQIECPFIYFIEITAK